MTKMLLKKYKRYFKFLNVTKILPKYQNKKKDFLNRKTCLKFKSTFFCLKKCRKYFKPETNRLCKLVSCLKCTYPFKEI